jgi:hypothetical protein
MLPPLSIPLSKTSKTSKIFYTIFYRDMDKKKTGVYIFSLIYTRADLGPKILAFLDVLDKLFLLLGKVQQIYQLGALNFGYGFGWTSIFG